MRIVIASDHAGFPLKKTLTSYIRQLEHDIVDVGTYGTEPADYPDYAEALSKTLIDGKAERGVLASPCLRVRRRILHPLTLFAASAIWKMI
jgi:ribose 5-phosphate isomerase B